MIGELLLIAAMVFTIGHLLMDARGLLHNFMPYAPEDPPAACQRCERRHKDLPWTVITVGFLVGHIIFTGEAAAWIGMLLP